MIGGIQLYTQVINSYQANGGGRRQEDSPTWWLPNLYSRRPAPQGVVVV